LWPWGCYFEILIKIMPEELKEEKIEIAPPEYQKPVEILEPEIRREEFRSERTFLSQIDDDLRFMEVVSTIPIKPPRNHFARIKIFVSGTVKRLYIWDGVNNVWTYVVLTT